MAQRQRRSARGRRGRTPVRYELTLSSSTLVRALSVAAAVLLAAHAVLALVHYRVEALHPLLLQLFDVDQENNLPTWFSEFLLLVACALLWIQSRSRKVAGDRWAGHWTVLCVGFLLMAIDEVAGIHETINSAIVMTWAIPAAIMAVGIGIAFIPFLLHLASGTALRFVVAGALYLTGAVGIEIIGNEMVGDRLSDTLGYKMATLAEESLEMVGLILFIHALLGLMRDPGGGSATATLRVD